MLKQLHRAEEIVTEQCTMSPCIGTLAGTNRQGEILVMVDGEGPYPARMLSGISRDELARHDQRGRELLLVFEKGDPERPIIVGLMADPLEGLLSLEIAGEKREESRDLLIDGRQITIEAEDEVILKCGKGSIQIRKDGKIVISGAHVLSKSSGANRIKGGHVDIN
ncbi:hypothetical protein OR1_01682 [Geobacter sp. OR-1]|uniref:DUF6484 domain-containing protein n=1 Tax=Geobacter sp. OR-1 TaxID=1266765 RepID=UPI0005443FA7|nr:DUF6484 domain-containing protein [Geobacter sp. OR-1]GAM09404.1 hypothetical protein OR1_01682 [Geobacter sp. OR-1]